MSAPILTPEQVARLIGLVGRMRDELNGWTTEYEPDELGPYALPSSRALIAEAEEAIDATSPALKKCWVVLDRNGSVVDGGDNIDGIHEDWDGLGDGQARIVPAWYESPEPEVKPQEQDNA